MNLNTENMATIMLVAEELIEDGQLWVKIDQEEIYLPELIEEIQKLQKQIGE